MHREYFYVSCCPRLLRFRRCLAVISYRHLLQKEITLWSLSAGALRLRRSRLCLSFVWSSRAFKERIDVSKYSGSSVNYRKDCKGWWHATPCWSEWADFGYFSPWTFIWSTADRIKNFQFFFSAEVRLLKHIARYFVCSVWYSTCLWLNECRQQTAVRHSYLSFWQCIGCFVEWVVFVSSFTRPDFRSIDVPLLKLSLIQ